MFIRPRDQHEGCRLCGSGRVEEFKADYATLLVPEVPTRKGFGALRCGVHAPVPPPAACFDDHCNECHPRQHVAFRDASSDNTAVSIRTFVQAASSAGFATSTKMVKSHLIRCLAVMMHTVRTLLKPESPHQHLMEHESW